MNRIKELISRRRNKKAAIERYGEAYTAAAAIQIRAQGKVIRSAEARDMTAMNFYMKAGR